MDLPLGLVNALESGNCVLFIGAGAGYETLDEHGAMGPAGVALAHSIATRFSIDTEGNDDLAAVAQLAESRHSRAKLISHIDRELSTLQPSEDLKWLLSMTWKAVYTTNYDDVIEKCYSQNPNPTQRPVPIATNSEFAPWDPRFEVPIFHLHGSLASPEGRESILITEADYARFRSRRQMLFDHFRLSFSGTPILYFGYRNRDPNWQVVTAEVRAEYAPGTPPQSFRVAPDTSALEQELLAGQGITTLRGTLADLRAAVELNLGSLRVEPSRLTALKTHVPSDLRDLFDESPAAVSRLLNSWDYVNQADFSSPPNTEAFLKGDRPSWSLVGQGISFERDLEKPLVDALVDFATDPKPQVRCDVILGPAGYGTSTLLMAVSAWFASNRVGRIFHLKPGMEIASGDIEFAASAFDDPVVFVVDNAGARAEQISEVAQLLRNLKVPAFLLLGDRLNEWRQRRVSLRAREHLLEPLSDGEIDRLLGALSQNNALGRLEPLTPELRFAAVKTRNQKELLVTMREVTEGKAFDAIIEGEYRNIEDPRAQELYGLVCAFSRSRSLARDQLCGDALTRNVTELNTLLREGLDGIVLWETVDEARGIEALRARHQVIAEIVWDRCLDRLERERVLMAALEGLNLSYGVDARAFEAFTRDDGAVDSLQTLEAKTRFFEEACRKDPLNAYIRQHYARMLRREERLELALGQIDLAIDMQPNLRVLHHTRGVILRDAALTASTIEVGRRRLAQSEGAFRGAINRAPRDEYAYQSLAELYLDWARSTTDAADGVAYVARAQEVVSEGLSKTRNHEGLYVVASKIERYLGDDDRRVDALRSALASAPTSVIVRYLLGNALRMQGEFAKAAEILGLGLQDNPDDPSLAWAFALTRYAQTGEYDESVSVLHLARLRGEHQPRFVATFGGMLVMSEQFDEASDVWRRAGDRNFSVEDSNRIAFRPLDVEKQPMKLKGRVSKVSTGYAFIAVPGMPDFFCPGSRFSGLTLRLDMELTFEPGFSARGPVAVVIESSSTQADGKPGGPL